MSNRKSNEDNPWHTAGLLGALSFEVATTTMLGYGAGWLIKRWTSGTNGWIMAGVFIGLVLGIIVAVISVKKFLEGTNG